MKTPTKIAAFLSPLPFVQGERMKVRGSETARTRTLQTLTLDKGEADIEARNANKEA
jgi:hypothetical protein